MSASALAKVLSSAIEAKLKKSTLLREELIASIASAAGVDVAVVNDIIAGQICPSRSELAACATVLDADPLELLRAAKADGCGAGVGDVEATEHTRRRSSGVRRYRLALAEALGIGLSELEGDFAGRLLDHLSRQQLSERARLCRALGLDAGTSTPVIAVKLVALLEEEDVVVAARHVDVDARGQLIELAERYRQEHGVNFDLAIIQVATEHLRLARAVINQHGYAGPFELVERSARGSADDPRQELSELAQKRAADKKIDFGTALAEVSAEPEHRELVQRVRAGYGAEAPR